VIYDFNWLAYLMTFMWGILDSSTNTHCLEMLGFEFEDKVKPYSVWNSSMAFGAFIFFIIQSFLTTKL
jgi:hypothetical protein